MKKFTSIGSFRHVYKFVDNLITNHPDFPFPQVLTFNGTVKLHGSNCSIRKTPDGTLITQSRRREITVADDNYGFAYFVHTNVDYIKKLFGSFNASDDVVIYGEWIGQGIQNKVAVSLLPAKQWVIFAVSINDTYYPISEYAHLRLPECSIYNITQGPVFTVEVDFRNPGNAINTINQYTNIIGTTCPWGEKFGIIGIGEGLVWTCCEYPGDSNLFFKSKDDRHKPSRADKGAASIDVQEIKSMQKLVDALVTEARLQQGIEVLVEMNIPLVHTSIGPYIKWISNDVYKEDLDAVTENGMDWKKVSKLVSRKAREYFINYINNGIDF